MKNSALIRIFNANDRKASRLATLLQLPRLDAGSRTAGVPASGETTLARELRLPKDTHHLDLERPSDFAKLEDGHAEAETSVRR